MNKKHNKILTALLATVIVTGIAQATDTKDKDAKELKLFSQAKFL